MRIFYSSEGPPDILLTKKIVLFSFFNKLLIIFFTVVANVSDEEMQEHYDNFFEDVFVECEDKVSNKWLFANKSCVYLFVLCNHVEKNFEIYGSQFIFFISNLVWLLDSQGEYSNCRSPISIRFFCSIVLYLVGLVVSMSDYWSWGHGFDPWHFHKF